MWHQASMASEREKRRVIAEGKRGLAGVAGWNPSGFRAASQTERLRQRIEEQRVGDALQDADRCEHCAKLRDEGDQGALCPAHLRKAMGL